MKGGIPPNAIPNVGGRDIAQILAPQGERRQPIPGFDPEYADIVDYILRCTHRIWEQKDVGLIATHYRSDIVVHMMTGPAYGIDDVIAGTSRTLSAFPDRTLTGEAVIWSVHGRVADRLHQPCDAQSCARPACLCPRLL